MEFNVEHFFNNCSAYIKGEPELTDAQKAKIGDLIEPWFFFALIWSVGGTTDNEGRYKFSEYLRDRMKEENVSLKLPKNLLKKLTFS